jgi:hypothetical protein
MAKSQQSIIMIMKFMKFMNFMSQKETIINNVIMLITLYLIEIYFIQTLLSFNLAVVE